MVTAIVLAAGRSTRMGGGENKQFLQLLGKPLVYYSLAAFEQAPSVTNVVVVRRPDYAEQAGTIVREFGFRKVVAFADGGAERQNSVWSGLQACPAGTEIVAVHDGARPLVIPELIEATIQCARVTGTGIASTKVVDTVKEADEQRRILRTVDRTSLWSVQTPQTARIELLRAGYEKVFALKMVVTDEAAAIKAMGHEVHLVEWPYLNFKITRPPDLAVAEALLRERQQC
jgi:2-C-methyl-D-erythritol 4-phosphate cytidylyltransferase